jgi:hypothetical protein
MILERMAIRICRDLRMRRKARERKATRPCAERSLPHTPLPSMKQHCPVPTSQFGLACGRPSAAGDYRLAECSDGDALADKSVQRRLANLDQRFRLAISKTPAALAAFQETEIEQVGPMSRRWAWKRNEVANGETAMTDHSRFERVQDSVDDAHLRYHYGRLVHALHSMDCSIFRRGCFRRAPHKINGKHIHRAAVGATQREKLGFMRGLLRLLVAVLASPKGEHGGWEGGARGL